MANKKLNLAPLQPQAARAFRYLQVPKLLMECKDYRVLCSVVYSQIVHGTTCNRKVPFGGI